ncbi:MAG: hypothetical protein RIS88_977 [Pseudomonadota bacterium]|jgi:2-oxo-3-hexenedioate decarboxylase/2-keto-4-pentenoate hydratase
MDEVNNVVRELANARRTHGVVVPLLLNHLVGFDEAYRLQESVRIALGAQVVGWKVAAPPAAEVISAPLFDIGCKMSDSDFLEKEVMRDGVECELALRIDRQLPTEGCTREDVLKAVGAVMPAFELLCSRLPAKFMSPREHIVADCLGQAAVVLGAPCVSWRAVDLAQLRVSLWADDAPILDKQGGNPFGDPLLAVALLANHLAQRGKTIAPGTFVLAGSHTGVHRAQPGERLRCVFEGIGEVALSLRETLPSKSKEHSDACR